MVHHTLSSLGCFDTSPPGPQVCKSHRIPFTLLLWARLVLDCAPWNNGFILSGIQRELKVYGAAAAAGCCWSIQKKSESNKTFHRENKSPTIPTCPCKLYQCCAVNMMVGWPSIEDEERRKGKRFFLFCFVLFFFPWKPKSVSLIQDVARMESLVVHDFTIAF